MSKINFLRYTRISAMILCCPPSQETPRLKNTRDVISHNEALLHFFDATRLVRQRRSHFSQAHLNAVILKKASILNKKKRRYYGI